MDDKYGKDENRARINVEKNNCNIVEQWERGSNKAASILMKYGFDKEDVNWNTHHAEGDDMFYIGGKWIGFKNDGEAEVDDIDENENLMDESPASSLKGGSVNLTEYIESVKLEEALETEIPKIKKAVTQVKMNNGEEISLNKALNNMINKNGFAVKKSNERNQRAQGKSKVPVRRDGGGGGGYGGGDDGSA